MARNEVLELKREVDSYCTRIVWQDDRNRACDLRREALEAIDRAGTEFEISAELRKFLRRKVLAALVAGGFCASEHWRAFGKKASRRYRGR